jgi:hypothetical protein
LSIGLLFVGISQAAIPLLIEGPVPAAAQRVSERTGIPEDQFQVVLLDDVLKGAPLAMGALSVRSCPFSPSKATDVRAAVTRAETALRSDNIEGAVDQLDLGTTLMGCLSERVEPQVASQLFVLRATVAFKQNKPELASQELAAALSFSPTLAWDAALSEDGATLLENVRSTPVSAEVRVYPGMSPSRPWVDGRPVEGDRVRLRPGLHHVQVSSTAGIRSVWMNLEGDGSLIAPTSYRRPVLEGLEDSNRRHETERLLQAAGRSTVVYALDANSLYLISYESEIPQTTPLIRPPKAADEPTRRGR